MVSVGETVTVSSPLIWVSPSNHSTVKLGAPEEGVNLQYSFEASQTPVFLPSGVKAIVPSGFWTPTTATPSFHSSQAGLSKILISIAFEDS